MKFFINFIVGVTLALVVALPAHAQNSMPSAKQTAAMGDLISLGVAASSNPNPDTYWVDVLKTYVKTANQKDLALDVALQCGIVTDTTVKSKGGQKSTSNAQGRISVRVKVTNLDTNEMRYADPSIDGFGEGVTFCSRVQELKANFSGLNCTADLTTGAVTCADPEELGLILRTLNANAFNFLLANVQSGVHEIIVQARAYANVELSETDLGEAAAEAFIGLGSMHVDEIRLIKDNDGSNQL